jgi:phytoene dehydrogenase-like protein
VSEHFDVCIFGGQPAGYLTAALCAKRGLRTAVIDNGEGYDQYKQKGNAFPFVPQPQIGLRSSKAVEAVLTELGAQVDFPRRYTESSISFQAIFPDQRISFATHEPTRRKELVRVFGAGAEAFSQATASLADLAERLAQTLASEEEVPALSTIGRFTQRRRLATAADLATPLSESALFAQVPEELRQITLDAARFFCQFDEKDPPIGYLAYLVSHLLAGTVRVDGSRGSYLDALVGLATQAGAVVKQGALVKEISADGSRLKAVETTGSRISLTADYFVSALYSTELWQELPRSRAQAKLVAEDGEMRSRTKIFVQHYLLEERGLPVGLADNVLLLNGRRRSRDDENADSSVWVTVRRDHTPRGDKTLALLSAAIPVAEQEANFLPEHLEAQKRRVRAQLERLLPFLPPYIAGESSPMAPGEWDKLEGGQRNIDSWLLSPAFEPLADRQLGITGLGFGTPYANLFRVGRRVLPGLGSLGDFVCARMAAGILQRAAKKK